MQNKVVRRGRLTKRTAPGPQSTEQEGTVEAHVRVRQCQAASKQHQLGRRGRAELYPGVRG